MKEPRILVIKHGALGDLVQGFDAFAGLRHGLPHAHITLLTSPAFVGLSRRAPWFDEVVEDLRTSALNMPQLLRMRRLFHADWDIILDLQCSRRTARYHQFLAPSKTRWFGTAPGASDPYPDFTGVNNADRMKVAIGMAGGDRDMSASLDWLVSDDPGDEGEGAVVLVPGCSPAKPGKRWPASSYAELANRFLCDGRKVVIVGTAADRVVADAVLRDAPACTDLVDQTGIDALAALFGRAHAVVGNDTGPVFLAARTGVPTLMVMGGDTDPSMSAPVGARAGWVRRQNVGDVTPLQAMDALAAL
ncbi:MAG: glycosyltransferase family 9 protein [Rhodobiaceae bacterium]